MQLTGWKEQYERMHRSLVRSQGKHPTVDAYKDDLYHFFQDCWHLKDWIKHDPNAPAALAKSIERLVAEHRSLMVAADVANGVKHFTLTNRRQGADLTRAEVWLTLGGDIDITAKHYVLLDDATELVAEEVAVEAVQCWVTVVGAYL